MKRRSDRLHVWRHEIPRSQPQAGIDGETRVYCLRDVEPAVRLPMPARRFATLCQLRAQ
jgi:hypothetical protein